MPIPKKLRRTPLELVGIILLYLLLSIALTWLVHELFAWKWPQSRLVRNATDAAAVVAGALTTLVLLRHVKLHALLSKEQLRNDIVPIENRYINSVHHLDSQFARGIEYFKDA